MVYPCSEEASAGDTAPAEEASDVAVAAAAEEASDVAVAVVADVAVAVVADVAVAVVAVPVVEVAEVPILTRDTVWHSLRERMDLALCCSLDAANIQNYHNYICYFVVNVP